MLYMIEIHYTRQRRADMLEYFWQHGSTHYEGKVTIQGAWVATQDQFAYALVNADDDQEVEKACAPWREFGEVTIRQVTSSDEI